MGSPEKNHLSQSRAGAKQLTWRLRYHGGPTAGNQPPSTANPTPRNRASNSLLILNNIVASFLSFGFFCVSRDVDYRAGDSDRCVRRAGLTLTLGTSTFFR